MTMPCVNRGFGKIVDYNFSIMCGFNGAKCRSRADLKQYDITCFNSLVLNIVLSVTYYFELHNPITIYCISQFLLKKGQIGCLDIIEH